MKRFLPAAVLLVTGFVAGLVLTGRMRSASESLSGTSLVEQTVSPATPSRAATPSSVTAPGPDFTRIASQAIKGVANISSLQVVRRPNSPFANDPFFSYFFGDQDAFGSRDRRSLSLGSGVVVSADGYIVTNNHVVAEDRRATMREVTVSLGDKREVHGTIVGTDPATDIALLKIDAKGLPTVPWGDSGKLQVGEWVLAIGSPFQLSQTVTAGIVSAVGRANIGITDYEDFIQTDAAINPGNSGGALINTRGELIGINTGIYSESGGYQGIGFAVPSRLAQRIVGDLMKFGEVQRGSIGYIGIEKLTPQLAEEVGVDTTSGALVSRMSRGSEAYDAGIRPGDVITAFNGQDISDPSQILRLVADSKPGTTATIKVLRNGRTLEFKLPIVSSSSNTSRPRR